jgi:outer membrane lipoprotein SlyB
MKILRLFFMAVTIGGFALAVQACAFTAGAVAGAAAGEALEEEGYELESPIQKDEDDR